MAVHYASTKSLPSTQLASTALNSIHGSFCIPEPVAVWVDDLVSATQTNNGNSSMNMIEMVNRLVSSVDQDIGILASSSTATANCITSRRVASFTEGDNKENVDPNQIHGNATNGYCSRRCFDAKRLPLQDITSMFQTDGRCINDNTQRVFPENRPRLQGVNTKPQVLKSRNCNTISNTNGKTSSRTQLMR